MPASVKHVRGTRTEWLKVDPVVPDGEIALSKENGRYSLHVGDGKSKFSELRGSETRIIDNLNDYIIELEVENNTEVRLGEVEELYLSFPEAPPKDYFAIVSFFCGEFGLMISYPEDTRIYFSGVDVLNGEFTPVNFNRYTLFFWYDGYLQCNVRSHHYEYE